MRVGILNPNPRRVRGGNRTTALRWAGILRRQGARVFLEEHWSGRECGLLIALNAWKSAASIRRYREAHPTAPIVVAITGTDLYTDGPDPGLLEQSLDSATRLVVLQELALEALHPTHRAKAVLIHQSVRPLAAPPPPRDDSFDVCVVANLRAVKDPLLAARAARRLPPDSRVRIVLVGSLLDGAFGEELARERAENPRLDWRGECPRLETLRQIASSRLLACTSRAEGGPGVISEALAHGTPVLSTDIPGGRGMLPAGYPGFFPVGDAHALAELIRRAEVDPAFLAKLAAQCSARAWICDPAREEEAWCTLLGGLPGMQ